MDAELDGVRSKATWVLVDQPDDKRTKILRSKWVYDLKIDNDGYVLRFKARIVAVGTTQVKGIQ